MQDQTDRSMKTSCNARPDHTFGSFASLSSSPCHVQFPSDSGKLRRRSETTLTPSGDFPDQRRARLAGPEPHTLTQLLQRGSISRPIGSSVIFHWEEIMQRRLCILAIGIGANALAAASALAQGTPTAAP
jgi:hypothetical protein